MKYEFRAADGGPCCRGNVIKYLCGRCRALAEADGNNEITTAWPSVPLVKVVVDANGVPTPYAKEKSK